MQIVYQSHLIRDFWLFPVLVLPLLVHEVYFFAAALKNDTATTMTQAYPTSSRELPFPFGYGAYPSECNATLTKMNTLKVKRPPLRLRALPEGMACHGVLLAAWRDDAKPVKPARE